MNDMTPTSAERAEKLEGMAASASVVRISVLSRARVITSTT